MGIRLKSFLIAAVMSISCAGPAISADTGWRENPQFKTDSDARRAVSGFGGWVIVTPDNDWREKWARPPEATPAFNTTEQLHVGESVTILIFFSNARTDAKGDTQVLCDLQVTRPDKVLSLDLKGADCFTGRLEGHLTSLRLARQWLLFKGEPDDPLGKYVVEIKLYDKNAGVTVPLKTTFELIR